MMAPDYAHWHGMFEVAERFYKEMIPQAREITKHAAESGQVEQAAAVNAVIDEILARPEHKWQEAGKKPASDKPADTKPPVEPKSGEKKMAEAK